MNNKKLRKGVRVIVTGYGRTKRWVSEFGADTFKGTITQKKGNSVFVQWDNSYVNDQMDIKEVKVLE